jgi:predicted secreted protein with PEFG-CTERM motif
METLTKNASRIIIAPLLVIMLTSAFSIQSVNAVDSWVGVRDIITGDYGEAVVGTGAALYIARGTQFYRYLPDDNSWIELASPPDPDADDTFKTGTALAWDSGNYIYALYGAATGDVRRWFYRYSISGNSWEALANSTVDQGEGDAIAWVGVENCVYATIGGEQRSTHFMRYDPSTNSWSDSPADPLAGMGDGASLVWTGDNYVYALRGEFLEDAPLYDFWRYSLTDNVWTAMADIPADPFGDGIGGVGDGGSLLYVGFWLSGQTNYVYALSGNQAMPENPVIPDNRTYRYTISTNSWERLADLPFGVGYYVGCRFGYADGHIYAWQGTPSTWVGGGNDLVKYNVSPTDSNPPTTSHNYNGLWHTTDFIISITATDDLSGVAETYYELNNAPTKTVSANGQPLIATEGANNTLEYWSVDKANNEELPHKVLTGIKLDKNPPTGSMLINNGAVYTNTTSVNLALSATDTVSGVSQMRFSNDNVTWSSWEQYATSKSWTLQSGDGTQNVIIQFKDIAGLVSSCNASIILDTTKPVANAGQSQTVTKGTSVAFNAIGCTDKIFIASYLWEFGDGTTGTGMTTTHTYSNAGTYTANRTVQDGAGITATSTMAITVQDNVIPEFPSFTIMILFASMTLFLVITKKKFMSPKIG